MAKATRKRAREAKAKKDRKVRSDKGLIRAVTKLKKQADAVYQDSCKAVDYVVGQKGAADTPAVVMLRNLKSGARAVLDGLDKLDGRMKVRFDPSTVEKK